ncbi:MAG: ubiquinol-cytochrome c reductase iron-sulfur subunit [Thermodesulfobacteriota bacterium]
MNISRRKFVGTAWILAGIALIGELIAGTIAFLWPRSRERKEELFIAGKVEDFKGGSIVSFRREKLHINRLDEGFLAMSSICTHLRCIVPWVERNNLFECPCHGGKYNRVGEVVAGPPPRPLDLHPVKIVEDKIVVDIGTVIRRKKFVSSQVVSV